MSSIADISSTPISLFIHVTELGHTSAHKVSHVTILDLRTLYLLLAHFLD